MLAGEGRDVDNEPEPDVGGEHPVPCLVDLLGRDDFDFGVDAVVSTEVPGPAVGALAAGVDQAAHPDPVPPW